MSLYDRLEILGMQELDYLDTRAIASDDFTVDVQSSERGDWKEIDPKTVGSMYEFRDDAQAEVYREAYAIARARMEK